MKPVIHLFTPIFFVMVGLSLNLRLVDWGSPTIWLLSGALFLVAVAGKMIGAFLVRERPVTRLLIGIAMVPRGEVGLIFAELGRTAGILGDVTYAALILVVALTTVAPAFVMKWVYGRYGRPG